MKNKLRTAVILFIVLMSLTAAASACKHVFGGWNIHRQPTCFVPGDKIRYCKKCDHWENAAIPVLRHEIDEWTVKREATCEKFGILEGVCKLCKSTRTQKIEMLPHTYGELETVKAATCSKPGQGKYVCVNCGAAVKETLDPLGHDWQITNASVQPTCKKPGRGSMACNRCGRTKDGVIPALKHNMSDWQIVKEPNNGLKGERSSVCSLCGEKVTEHYYLEGTLYENMDPCAEVIQLQTMLKDLGYYGGSIKSGKFGAQTSDAANRFRKANHIKCSAASKAIEPALFDMIREQWEAKTGKTLDDIAASVL